MKRKYNLVALGGTFDRFHEGHKELLDSAFSISHNVVIGITDQSMIEHKMLAAIIAPYNERKRAVQHFLRTNKYEKRAHIVLLHDVYGPVGTNRSIQAVIVGPRVDKKTLTQLRSVVPVVQCKTIHSSDGTYLSSTRIRTGEVGRDGRAYALPDHTLYMPPDLIPQLRTPLGSMVFDTSALETRYAPLIIGVGDATVKRLVDDSIFADLTIIDHMIGRSPSPYSLSELGIQKDTHTIVTIKNPAGTITKTLFASVVRFVRILSNSRARKFAIIVDGEEDLAVLPAIYSTPLTSFVWYGQPKISRQRAEGLVGVEVTEKTKNHIADLLQQFTSKRVRT